MGLLVNKDELFLKEAEALHSLRALEAIENDPGISQRELSNHLGVALGITNALLKTLVRKGLIKIRGTNNRSLTYHLTHAGVLAKSRLAMQWTLNTIDFYRQARQNVACRLAALSSQGIKTIALYGRRELIEITAIVAPEVGLDIVGIIKGEDQIDDMTSALGFSVITLGQLIDVNLDALIICSEADSILDELRHHVVAKTQLHRLI